MTLSGKDPREPLTLARFTELVEAYGAELARWPELERARASELIEAQPQAAELLAEAAELDALLDGYRTQAPSPRLRARVLEVPLVAARRERRFGLRLAWAFAFSCAIGIFSGAYTADDASVSEDDEWSELAALSFDQDLAADYEAWNLEDEP